MPTIAVFVAACGTAIASTVQAQELSSFLVQESGSMGEGWTGFADVGFLLNALLNLTLAAILGAIIAYHPKHGQTADTLDEIEAPKVYVVYAVIGALTGIMVVKYGLVVGFVLFGIGGLIRFRTALQSASLTGHVIFVTLIGLSCGLDLPHVAVLSTVFGFILLYILGARVTYRIDVKALPLERVTDAAAMYREVLERHGCRILRERKNPMKQKVTFVFQTTGTVEQTDLENILESEIDARLKGALDWEVD